MQVVETRDTRAYLVTVSHITGTLGHQLSRAALLLHRVGRVPPAPLAPPTRRSQHAARTLCSVYNEAHHFRFYTASCALTSFPCAVVYYNHCSDLSTEDFH